MPEMPPGVPLYVIADWPGRRGASGGSWLSTSLSERKVTSQVAQHWGPDMVGTIMVTTHHENDYEENRDWAPTNMFLYEVNQMEVDPTKRKDRMEQLRNRQFDSDSSWNEVEGSVDGVTHIFEVLEFGSSFAAAVRLPSASVTLYSGGLPLPALHLVSLLPELIVQ